MTSFLVLQLADAAFPSGGFVHSGGLEALWQAGEIRTQHDLEGFVSESIEQAAHFALPMIAAVHDDPSTLARVDRLATAMLWSAVAAHASQAQGRAFLDTAARSFANEALLAARQSWLLGEIVGHLAPIHGLVTRTLGVSRSDALATYLHLSLRGILSAAVRLGACGPVEAQGIQHRARGTLESALARGRGLRIDDVAQTAPVAEIFQAAQDRLYSRLFQS